MIQNIIKKSIAVVAGLLVLLAAAVPAFAQAGYTVKISLADKTVNEPVSFATVSLTRKGASKASKYALTDHEGKAEMKGVTTGTYIAKAEMMGYVAWSQEITVKANMDLGEIEMKPDQQVLDAASVSAVGNPITIKKDTIEYNAASFKTTDNDMLEDLLKKLPGVEVSEDGSVTVNGETVKKITIDGKTFFLDDPQLATKNIPAKIVNKLKVVEKMSDQAQFTGIDDGERETVIDLSVQKGMMNGSFGNIMLGAGHDLYDAVTRDETGKNGDYRYQGAAFLGNFTESRQISVILNANNTNNRGFNDFSGSAMSGMRGGGGGMGRGQGGWGNGNGITTSYMAGVNGAWTLLDGDMDLGGNYLFNGTQKLVSEESSKTTYLNDHNLDYKTKGTSETNSYGHRVGMRLEHKFSESTSILFQPSINFGTGNFHEISDFSTNTDYLNGTVLKTNEGFNNNSGENKNVSAEGFFLFRQRLGAPGRTLSFMGRYSFSNNDLTGFNQSLTREFDQDDQTSYKDSVFNQRYDNNKKSASVNGRLTLTQPLGHDFYLEGNYSYGWNKNVSDKKTYDNADNTGFAADNLFYNKAGEILSDVYSSSITNRYINQTIGLNLMYQKDKMHAQVGFGVNPTNTHNETVRNGVLSTYDSKVVKWAPSAMLFYDISDNSNIRFFYMGRSSQPSTSQLMPVPDNTDPLNVSFGNPYLKPYFAHNLRGDMKFTNKKTYMSFSTRFSGGYTQNPITSALWYGSNGATYTMPFNGPSSGNASVRTFLNTPVAKSNFSIFNMFNANYSQSSSYVGTNVPIDNYYNGGELDYQKFHQDFDDIDNNAYFKRNTTTNMSLTERLRVTYRNDDLEIQAGARTRFSKSWYSIKDAQTATFNNQANGSVIYSWSATGLSTKAELEYNWYNGYTTQMDDEYVFNMEISKLLFKNKVTATLKGYDIFNQAKNLSVSDTDNYHKETINNTLGRYIILSFTYRFGQQQKNNRRGFGGGHGGMYGPPPGR